MPSEPGPRVPGAGGVEIATYHLGGTGPPVMLLHATGFHGRCWLPMAPALTDHFDVWSIDQRGHGSSGKAPDGRYQDWSVFVDDLFAVLDALGAGQWRGIGHSLGGAVLLLAEQRRPGTFAELCCYEPVVVPPTQPIDGLGRPVSMSDLVRKRRPRFASRQEAYDNYAAKPPMSRFDPAALRAYVTFGFVDEPHGGVTLACTREDEASIYEGAALSNAWEHLPAVRAPVAVLGGSDPEDPVSRAVEDVARRLPRGGARRFEQLSHFGPLEDPLGVGRVAAAALGAGRASSSGKSGKSGESGDQSTIAVAPPQ
jgi:pimeloyl-ACP methyl ester carboxylesterase